MNISAGDLTISDLLKGDLKLAAPPTIYFELKTIIDDPLKAPHEAAFVIESDAALAAKILKIVNSAFYGFPAQISSIARAITLIGSLELQNLVLSTLIIERFSVLPGQQFSMHDFWARNLRCALLTRELDAQMGNNYSEAAFLCGLLHNLGQLLFYMRIPVLAREVELLMQASLHEHVLDEVRIEQQVIGFDHFQAGAELCRIWNLPEIFVETIRLHAFPDHIGPYTEIAAMVRLANSFSSMEHHYDTATIDDLPLSPQQIAHIIDMTNEEFDAIFKLFYP